MYLHSESFCLKYAFYVSVFSRRSRELALRGYVGVRFSVSGLAGFVCVKVIHFSPRLSHPVRPVFSSLFSSRDCIGWMNLHFPLYDVRMGGSGAGFGRFCLSERLTRFGVGCL